MLPAHFYFLTLLAVIGLGLVIFVVSNQEVTLDDCDNEREKLKHKKLAALWFLGTLYAFAGFLLVSLTSFSLGWMAFYVFLGITTATQSQYRLDYANSL